MTAEEDIAMVAGQLADLTRTVTEMETQVRTLLDRADSQQERIGHAARELTEVSARLQAAADALLAAI